MKHKTKDDMILELFHPLFQPNKSIYDYSVQELETVIERKKKDEFNQWLRNAVNEAAEKFCFNDQYIHFDKEELETLQNLYFESRETAKERLNYLIEKHIKKVNSQQQLKDLVKIKDSIVAYCKKYLDFTPNLEAHVIEECLQEFANEAEAEAEVDEKISEFFKEDA